MKKLLNVFFVIFFIICLGVIIGTICVVVNCCSGNKVTIYDGELEKSKILIEKNLGNATMASYLTVCVALQCYLFLRFPNLLPEIFIYRR